MHSYFTGLDVDEYPKEYTALLLVKKPHGAPVLQIINSCLKRYKLNIRIKIILLYLF